MPRRSEPAAGAFGQGKDQGRGGKGEPGGPRTDTPGGDTGGAGTGGGGRPCPVCGKPSQAATRPFCCKRCRDVDLNRWLSGSYVVPGSEAEDEGAE